MMTQAKADLLTPSRFIWGLFAVSQGFTKTWGGLVACRFLMGKIGASWIDSRWL